MENIPHCIEPPLETVVRNLFRTCEHERERRRNTDIRQKGVRTREHRFDLAVVFGTEARGFRRKNRSLRRKAPKRIKSSVITGRVYAGKSDGRFFDRIKRQRQFNKIGDRTHIFRTERRRRGIKQIAQNRAGKHQGTVVPMIVVAGKIDKVPFFDRDILI